MKKASWSISEIWNRKLAFERGMVRERPYVSASDIGMPFLDRFYKMKGVKPTNPFDERILRIFDAGNTIEWLMLRIFRLAGILISAQGRVVVPETKTCLPVYGYFDAIVGGRANWEKSKEEILAFISRYNLKLADEFIENKAMGMVTALEEKYPDGLKPIVAEIKTVHSMAFHAHKNKDKAGFFKGYPHHKFQVLTYIMGQEIKEGRLFYISRDDLCLQETAVFATPQLRKTWSEDVETMTDYFKRNIEPKREPDLVFNETSRKWEANWRIGRSLYITKITGAKDKKAWEKKVRAEAARRNRVIKRVIKKAELTESNKKVIKEMRGRNKVLDKILPKKGS